MIEECQYAFNNFVEEFEAVSKRERIVNDLLAEIPDVTTVEVSHISAQIEKQVKAFQVREKKIKNFAQQLKAGYTIDKHFFSFFDLPELITKQKMSKKDFSEISKNLLFKTQKLYLLHKAQLMPEIPMEKLKITDEDMVPLDLITEVI